MPSHSELLRLLQLASPSLPVGAYSYSEGIEALVETGKIQSQQTLEHWLVQELRYGAIRLEAAVMVRAYRAAQAVDWERLNRWNHWLSAARETEELRSQSFQMGRSLLHLFLELQTSVGALDVKSLQQEECHFAIVFGMVAADWQIDLQSATLGYLHSWSANLVSAGVKLIPLGQTAGQQLLWNLQPIFGQASEEILLLQDEDLSSCGWGLALASMAHETQYSRLFRS
jgi:urease accessory protein